jgi:type IV pilus assembly protein PilC
MSAEKDFFLENFSLLLRSGMPVTEALGSLKEEIHSSQMRKAVSVIIDEVASGSNISDALEKSKLLPSRFISLMRIGEETGKLSDQLALIITQRKKEKLLKSKIQSALIYPAFVLGITGAVGILVVWYVFPKLATIFAQANGTLPLTTRSIIAIGHFFTAYGIVAVPTALIFFGLIFFFLYIYKKTRHIGESILLHISASKILIQEIELARFGYILGTLVSAGISLPDALISVGDSTSFVLYKRFYARIVENINEGNSLYTSITAYPDYARYIPGHIARLLLAGEMSGSLSESLMRISEEYEQKLNTLTQNLSALLEPAIILIVGIIVAIIALGIISPIYGLVNQI